MSSAELVAARRLAGGSPPARGGIQKPLAAGSGARRPAALPVTLGRLADLEVRLATSPAELRDAQELRYKVFYEERAAVADARMRELRLDADPFDRFCQHLLVLDHAKPHADPRGRPKTVATCRLLRQEIAARHGGFYTETEYDLAPLLARHANLNFLELGRSCVLETYRNKRTLELLWHGIWSYVLWHEVEVMIGCASLAGTEPDRLALPLSFLQHHARAPADWSVRARGDLRVEMDRMPLHKIEYRAALRALPPLVKGYLRLGAYVGDGAVVDRQFGTTDVCIILPVAAIEPRYVAHYGADAGRYAS